MKILRNNSDTAEPKIATIGFFDGVHLGHQYLINQLKETGIEHNLKTTIVTFPEHPRKVLNKDYSPQLLTTLDEKIYLLNEQGIDYCMLLDFTKELAALTAYDFMKLYLKEKLNVKILLIGHDHHFGSDKNLCFEDYERLGKELGIILIKEAKYTDKTEENLCSSTIRNYIKSKQFKEVTLLQNHPYQLTGIVVKGQQLGRTIHFPTANINIDKTDKIIPPKGVYCVKAKIGDKLYNGMANLGVRPTVNNSQQVNLEVHIFDFKEDIYNRQIEVLFFHYIREEQTFANIHFLQEALQKDKQFTLEYFAKNGQK